MYQNYLQRDVFLDDEDEVELEDGSKSTPETVFKVDTKAEKQVLDSDSEDSDSSDDSDSESEEEVKATPPPKKGKNTKKSA